MVIVCLALAVPRKQLSVISHALFVRQTHSHPKGLQRVFHAEPIPIQQPTQPIAHVTLDSHQMEEHVLLALLVHLKALVATVLVCHVMEIRFQRLLARHRALLASQFF